MISYSGIAVFCNFRLLYIRNTTYHDSICFMVPCAMYEAYLCLCELSSQSKRLGIKVFLLYPFAVVAFIGLMIREMLGLRSMLIVDYEFDHLKYPIKEMSEDELPTPIERRRQSELKIRGDSTLSVRCIRGELRSNGKFSFNSAASLMVEMQLGSQRYATSTSEVAETNGKWHPQWNHEMIFHLSRSTEKNIQVRLKDMEPNGDVRIMGSCQESILRWIANGRFEGPLLLRNRAGDIVGSVSLAVKLINPATLSEYVDPVAKPPLSPRAAIFASPREELKHVCSIASIALW